MVVLIIAGDGQKHVLDGKKLQRVPRERQTSVDILWLKMKEQLLHAPLCVVSCFASVHNEQNHPSFFFSQRKLTIHTTGCAGYLKRTVHIEANISVSCLREASIQLVALVIKLLQTVSTCYLIAVTFLSLGLNLSGNHRTCRIFEFLGSCTDCCNIPKANSCGPSLVHVTLSDRSHFQQEINTSYSVNMASR